MYRSRSSQCDICAPPRVTQRTLGMSLNHGYRLRFVTSSVLPLTISVSTAIVSACFQPSHVLREPVIMNSAGPWLLKDYVRPLPHSSNLEAVIMDIHCQVDCGILLEVLEGRLHLVWHWVYGADETTQENLRCFLKLFALMVATSIAVFQCLANIGWQLSQKPFESLHWSALSASLHCTTAPFVRKGSGGMAY